MYFLDALNAISSNTIRILNLKMVTHAIYDRLRHFCECIDYRMLQNIYSNYNTLQSDIITHINIAKIVKFLHNTMELSSWLIRIDEIKF